MSEDTFSPSTNPDDPTEVIAPDDYEHLYHNKVVKKSDPPKKVPKDVIPLSRKFRYSSSKLTPLVLMEIHKTLESIIGDHVYFPENF